MTTNSRYKRETFAAHDACFACIAENAPCEEDGPMKFAVQFCDKTQNLVLRCGDDRAILVVRGPPGVADRWARRLGFSDALQPGTGQLLDRTPRS